MTNRNWFAGGALAVALVLVAFLWVPSGALVPRADHETAYRLVPEKVSRSAAIAVVIPEGQVTTALEQAISFTPAISGRWLEEKVGSTLVPVAHAARNTQTYYFQPSQPLEENRHYAVAVTTANNEVLSSDFYVVADPEIISILPANDEVLTNTKISIVFNRPMVPLSTLDEMTGEVPVTITPTTPGRFKWISTNTLQFIPATELISSTQYEVSVGEGLKSMEGLSVEPKKSAFSTRHLRYGTGADGGKGAQMIVRGYNQPFLVRFNQPIDLGATSRAITVSDGTRNVQFTAGYWKVPKDKKNSTEGDFFGNLYKSLRNTAAGTDAAEETEDQTMLAIYPEGGASGNWEPGSTYTVTISKAYPKSGGSIIISQPERFTFEVDDIVSYVTAESKAGTHVPVEKFDPAGRLTIMFYEPINLERSSIDAPGLKEVVYGEKCSGDAQCTKVQDRTKIVLTFKENSFKPGEEIPVKLNKIIADTSRPLTSKPHTIDLKVYEPLVIKKVTSGNNLSSITVCTNNRISREVKDHTINLVPGFVAKYVDSYLVSYINTETVCEMNEYQTTLQGDLMPTTRYTGSIIVTDLHKQTAKAMVDFATRAANKGDYDIRGFQDRDVVTVPGKTKLSYSARYLPAVTVNVCKVAPYNYFKSRANGSNSSSVPCISTVSRTIQLPPNGGANPVTVDVQDYYPDVIGNYMVTLSSPLIQRDSDWDPSRTFVSVTNLIVTEKKITPVTANEYESLTLSNAQLGQLHNLYWAINAATREPVAGATISVYKNGSVVASAVTNTQGLAFIPPITGSETAIATYGNDSVVISENRTNISYASRAANLKQMYMYTDKPLYRPGQEVNIKGIYRTGYDGFYEVPAHESLTLKVYDSTEKIITERKLTTNSYGSISTTVALGSESMLGSYRACIEYSCSYFEVLNYAPAAFRVTFDPKEEEFFLGQQPKVPLKADYYFGVPLSGAEVSYRLSSQHYYFDKYAGEYFTFNNLYRDEYGTRYYYGDRYLGEGRAVLNEQGEVVIEPDLKKNTDTETSKIIILDATVKNQQGRSIGGQKSFVMHAAPAYIGSKLSNSFIPSGQATTMKLKTVDTKGQPLSLGSIKVETYRVKWVSSQGDTPYSYSSWRRERELVNTQQVKTDRDGNGSVEVSVQGEGEYEIDVSSKGNAVGSRSWMYVYGGNAVSVRSSADTYLNVISSTDNLKPGETGEIVFEVPEGSAKALVTVERGRVYTYEVINVTGTIANYKFPVTPAYYPNVYVSVVAYPPGREVRIGSKHFVVDSDQKKINLSVTAQKKTYNPGEVVNLSIVSTDDLGQPVSSEVSVAVVDMSVLALRGNPKKDPLTEFYGHIPLTVGTYSNFKNLLKYVDPREADGKGGSGGDPNSQKRRGVFKEVAYWNPTIVTDASGRANITFTLPDNLTTWQAEAVAVTRDTRVGAAYHEFTTNKQLMINPLKPRFVLAGDEFAMGATIFNRSSAEFNGKVTLQAPALEFSTKGDQNIAIRPNESKTVYWDVKVPVTQKSGAIEYSLEASGSGLSDAFDDELSIKPNSTYETVATAGQTTTSARESVYLPAQVGTDRGELTLRSSATLAVFMADALKFMTEYPYTSTAHLSSQVRAVALIKRAQKIPNVQPAQNEAAMDQFITKNLQTIYARQNTDGGFAYWSGARMSSYHATIEAIDAFRVLSEVGVSVDDSKWQKAAAYLYTTYTTSNRVYGASDTVELLSALFTRPEYRSNATLQQSLARSLRLLMQERTTSSGSLVAATRLLHRYNMSLDVAAQIDRALENKVVVDSRGSFLDTNGGGRYYETPVSTTAGYIDLLVMRKKDDPQLPGLMRWLLASRANDGAWGSTHNTLAAVEALSDYLDWQKETSANYTIKNSVNQTVVQEFSFTPKTVLTQLEKVIPLNGIKSGEVNSVTFAKADPASAGKIYYDMSLKYYLPANELPERDEGFTIKRGMHTLQDIKSEGQLTKVKVGDVVRARVEVTVPVSRRDVIIEDFIPAGMEIIDTNLATEDQSVLAVEKQVKNSYLWPDHKEVRDDRYVLVIDELSPGTYSFDYFLRALVPGTYTHLPARASETFNPENFGRTGAAYFTIEK